ncbi:MAG TPA: formate dehydrogenase accessory protein FdhE [Chloroflexota bacterium]|jgi:FdhE protein|nr:formate dehydrogenase accessory protein FdhE [Chloroflexota bacterium]
MRPPAEILALLDRRVAALRKTRPDLEAAISLQEQLIRTALNSARPPHAEPFAIPRDVVAARVRHGVPLLHDQPAVVDVHFAADLFSRLVNVLQQREDEDVAPRLQALVEAATGGALDPQQLFAEAFVQHRDHLADLAARAMVDADLLITLATQAVTPLLRAYAEHLLPAVERVDDGSPSGASWQRGYCPVCGGWPLLAELRGVELAQFLRCSACGSGWRSRRILCTYCGNDDFHDLGTLQVEGEARFRMAVCERCKGYLKIGNAFDPPPPELVALDDLASIALDVAAIERGYSRPASTGFAIELALPESELAEELA